MDQKPVTPAIVARQIRVARRVNRPPVRPIWRSETRDVNLQHLSNY